MTLSSRELFRQAQECIPGGVNSPVRACLSVGAEPLFVDSAKGGRIFSVDGNAYADFVQSWGPMLLGHAHPRVFAALHAAVDRGTSFGAPCPDEVRLARLLVKALPAMDMVRMVNSGTEAAMSALRLARACTGRSAFLKFEGCYHGHADPFLAAAGSGVASLSLPGTPGVPPTTVADTLLCPYNDLKKAEKLFEERGEGMAAVIVEPLAGNMGLVLPLPGFLEGLRELCSRNGVLLIFDEVITGFRVAYGGAQTRFGINPDLTVLGKIIGGGLPIGAYGGKAEYMRRIAPSGDVYQAGTLSGNPLAMAAGAATLETLKDCDYHALEQRVEKFCLRLEKLFADKNIPVRINRCASMFSVFFTPGPVRNFVEVGAADAGRYARFFRHMRDRGVFLAPSAFETAMTSFAHSDGDFDAFEAAARSFGG
ncbi:MAG: glutamate-1-semialdehyde 2,1-aminomutase [Desulfovibrio sp.]|jgi:glutamate-1-semialdehyde 2,1-aminomutase|nr:glutamate-1-semialdehyde 2,1-aminomutase [Desulfovibrio sp.]